MGFLGFEFAVAAHKGLALALANEHAPEVGAIDAQGFGVRNNTSVLSGTSFRLAFFTVLPQHVTKLARNSR